MTTTTTRKAPQDHLPPQTTADAEQPHPAGWDLLKPFDEVPVWDQAELIATVQPILGQLRDAQGDVEGDWVDLDIAKFDVTVIGRLAKQLTAYAVDEDAYLKFVSGPGALKRAVELGVAYAQQLGE